MALGTSKCCQKGSVCNSTQLILNEILRSTLARLAFCENLGVDLAKNKYRLSVLSGLNLEKTYGRSFRSRDKEKCPYKAGFECIQWQAKSELNTFLSNIADKITFIGLGEVRRVILGNWLDTWISVAWYCKRYPFANPDESKPLTETRYKNRLLRSEDYYLENFKVIHWTSIGNNE